MTVEVTLQIENVPLVLAYYEIYISQVNGGSGEFFIDRYTGSPKLPKPWIKAVNESGNWTFEEVEPKQFISDNPNEVTFRIEFARRYTSPTALPTTITPTLLIRWKDFNNKMGDPSINRTDSAFFENAIAIQFESE